MFRRGKYWFGLFAVTTLVFGRLGNPPAPGDDVGLWLTLGGGFLAAAAFAAGVLFLTKDRWRDIALFALIAAALTGLLYLGSAAGANSSACPQPTDCDTGFALGAPFVIGALFFPYFAFIALGRWTAAVIAKVRLRRARQVTSPPDLM